MQRFNNLAGEGIGYLITLWEDDKMLITCVLPTVFPTFQMTV